ncbi:MAG TPA: hypothetical protein VFO25_12660 [Candidatus Eremiobacteraceae bacterium]|nr:hypothetical protein [Candidatus Eremiobacteraceae bacterium]
MTSALVVCMMLALGPIWNPASMTMMWYAERNSAHLSATDAASPAPPASPAGMPLWLGLALGESTLNVRATLGKPLEIVPTSAGDLWRYDFDRHNVGLELLFDQDQLVNIAARMKPAKQSSLADPFGGALGMSAAALQTARGAPIATYDSGSSVAYGESDGVRWFYTIDNGQVSAIEESRPLPPTPPPAQVVVDAAHDGTSIAKALVVTAKTDADAVNAEYVYIRGLECGVSGTWQVTGQSLISQGSRYYDQLHATCTNSKLSRDFYFDITTSFGH